MASGLVETGVQTGEHASGRLIDTQRQRRWRQLC